MALTELQTAHVTKLLSAYCDRVPAHVRNQLRYGFRIQGNSVELYEARPRFDNPAQWLEHPVAKFQYVAVHNSWRLFCKHRDLKWHRYEALPEAPHFEALLREVRDDPTHIFWG